MKIMFVYFLFLLASSNVVAKSIDSDGIQRLPDGSVHLMSYYDAMRICPTGTHLPTAHEYAEYALSMGFETLFEGSPEAGRAPSCGDDDWACLLYVGNPYGTVDYFAYYGGIYRRPSGDLGQYRLWVSSIDLYKNRYIYFAGKTGHLNYVTGNSMLAVRCFKDK